MQRPRGKACQLGHTCRRAGEAWRAHVRMSGSCQTCTGRRGCSTPGPPVVVAAPSASQRWTPQIQRMCLSRDPACHMCSKPRGPKVRSFGATIDRHVYPLQDPGWHIKYSISQSPKLEAPGISRILGLGSVGGSVKAFWTSGTLLGIYEPC